MSDTLSTEKMLNVLIAEDHEFTRIGLHSALKRKSNLQIIGEAENGEDAVAIAIEKNPDIILMDIGMPKLDGIKATQTIKEKCPEIKIIMLSSRQLEEEILSSISAGADAYCLKDITTERLIQVIYLVAEGGIWLDPYIAKV